MIEIESVQGNATIQDGGRAGHMHEGVPTGGALVLEHLACANVLLGNPPLSAAIEVSGRIEFRARGSALHVATSTGQFVSMHEGETFSFRSQHRADYVAIGGGIDVPSVLGGKGTFLHGEFGGYLGRGLLRGDRLPIGNVQGRSTKRLALVQTDSIRIVIGPDAARFREDAIQTLAQNDFAISRALDRVGTRLLGSPLLRTNGDGDTGTSMPMVLGAIQVTASGEAIVLGPDHPTTGGYPLIATVARVDIGRFHLKKPGDVVRFRWVELEEAVRSYHEHRAYFFD